MGFIMELATIACHLPARGHFRLLSRYELLHQIVNQAQSDIHWALVFPCYVFYDTPSWKPIRDEWTLSLPHCACSDLQGFLRRIGREKKKKEKKKNVQVHKGRSMRRGYFVISRHVNGLVAVTHSWLREKSACMEKKSCLGFDEPD